MAVRTRPLARLRWALPKNAASLLAETRGANLVEYIAILGLVALLAIAGFELFGGALRGQADLAAERVAQLEGSGGGCPGGVCTNGTSCFVAGTKVATPSGPKAIETLRAGEEVLSRDPETFAVVVRSVAETFVTPNAALVEVAVAEAPDAPVRATPGHPFFTTDRGWIGAGDLEGGEPLLDARGAVVHVAHVVRLAEHATVYNFEVEGTHTYFVGDARLWVHNPTQLGGCAGGSRAPAAVPSVLYHYTNTNTVPAIVQSGELRPSSAGIHGRYGDGVYMTDLPPGYLATQNGFNDAHNQFYNGKAPQKLTGYVGIDPSGLPVTVPNPAKPNIYLIPGSSNVPIDDRIVEHGRWNNNGGRWNTTTIPQVPPANDNGTPVTAPPPPPPVATATPTPAPTGSSRPSWASVVKK